MIRTLLQRGTNEGDLPAGYENEPLDSYLLRKKRQNQAARDARERFYPMSFHLSMDGFGGTQLSEIFLLSASREIFQLVKDNHVDADVFEQIVHFY